MARAALILALWLGLAVTLPAPALAFDIDRYPLESPDTSSPRGTLESFLGIVNDAVAKYEQEGITNSNYEGFNGLIRQAVRCVDLSEANPGSAVDFGIETTVYLKEVLDRIELPPLEQIPDKEAMRAAIEAEEPARWTIPHTDITIARVAEGPRKGEYLFDPETVRRAREFYLRTRHLPYKPGATPALYEFANFSPGWMISERWIRSLPAWAKTPLFDQAIWQWTALLLVLLLGWLLLGSIHRWIRGRVKKKRVAGEDPTSSWYQSLTPLSTMLIAHLIGTLAIEQLGITGDARWLIATIAGGIFYLATAMAVLTFGNWVAEQMVLSGRFKPKSVDAHLTRTGVRMVTVGIAIVVVLAGAHVLGVPVVPLLAGVGVGGLAVALAAQTTIENLIGGLTLFADQPVRVGDFCRYGDKVGTVEQIGLRSTRLRSLDRTVVSVPNSEFSKLQLENYTQRDQILMKAMLGLRYETTPEQLRYVMANLREMLIRHPRIGADPARVRFVGFGAYSLDLEMFAYARTNDWDEFLSIREDVFLRVMDIVKEAGTGFAFPSQTNYMARDDGLDDEQVQQAEARVQAWREAGILPYPDFPEELRWEAKDTLDFPPKGSPEQTAFKKDV